MAQSTSRRGSPEVVPPSGDERATGDLSPAVPYFPLFLSFFFLFLLSYLSLVLVSSRGNDKVPEDPIQNQQLGFHSRLRPCLNMLLRLWHKSHPVPFVVPFPRQGTAPLTSMNVSHVKHR
eukprot:TRINITY_DN59237_c0_g1_i1.p1 TRINITY_DN59237_c0_g1~~TRINITY_DN59237_c0_g1_i1.p1  ORF type:complete len:120 (+),score=3.34 TRINITY_DN59237_c0_g1_i1:323-682(+)